MDRSIDIAPRAVEAERAILGSVLIDNMAIEGALTLTPEHFYDMHSGMIWAAMLRLYHEKRAIDARTVVDELGGAEITYSDLANLYQETPSAQNVTEYAQNVFEAATRRALIEAGSVVARQGHADFQAINVCLDTARTAIDAVIDGYSSAQDTTQHVRDIVGDVLVEALVWKDDPQTVRGVSSGLSPVDDMMGGFQAHELTSITARPGQGKSALLARLAWGMGQKRNPVVLFSLEMTARAMIRRMGCQMAHVSATDLKAGRLSTEEFKRWMDAEEEIATYPLWVEARAGLSVLDMKARARRYERKYGLACVMVDTFNRVLASGGSQYEITTNKSHAMADWAHESDYAIIQAVQLSRANERAQDKRPTLDAMRDSGAVEEDNDNVLGLYRPHYYDRENDAIKNEAELRVLKFRDGDSDAFATLFWRPECVSFDRGEWRNPADQPILGQNTH